MQRSLWIAGRPLCQSSCGMKWIALGWDGMRSVMQGVDGSS